MSAPPESKAPKNNEISGDKPIERLLAVMVRLRDPERGCPWDIEQTFESIIPHTIEEAYEVADAIERGDMDDVKDELGDLLMQVVFHARMAEEKKLFDFNDVVENLVEKLVFRHPHVFGDQSAADAAEVVDIWEAQKAKKRRDSGALAGVTRGLPALLRAQKLQKKAAKQGFSWKNPADAWAKVDEEYAELQAAISQGDQAHIAEELGDLLFCLVNYARLTGHDAEEVMRKANEKFILNFNNMEKFVHSKNKELADCGLAELLDAWTAAKKSLA
jgi:MazG family protein